MSKTIGIDLGTTNSVVAVMEGDEVIKTLQLPANKTAYRNGLLSFGPTGSVVTATRPKDDPAGEVWLMQYQTEKEGVRSLFPWKKEPMVDFVVGPRMYWEGNTRKEAGSVY